MIEYDSNDPKLTGLEKKFRDSPRQTIGRSGAWKEATFTLPHARFAGGANGSDFRLACTAADLVVRRVSLRRPR